jgi:hypothetical protein
MSVTNQTCSHIRKHSESRFLWITILTIMRSRRPLPCPSSHNISNMNLAELVRMARQACTLDNNWKRQAPEIIGAVRVMSCHPETQIVAIVPGANLIVLHSDEGSLVCLDTNSTKSLGRIPVGHCIVAVSRPFEENGTFMIAVATRERQRLLALHSC